MMATAGPPSGFCFLPLLESLEDGAAGQSEQTDAYLTIANRLSGEEGRQFLPAVEKHFCRLGNTILTHITSPNAELSQAALQALGFCVYHSHVVSGVSETYAADILSALCSLLVKSTEKNTCTRALWVISKQSFRPDVVSTKVPSILRTLESVWSKEDIQSVVMEHEALNVVIRMLEQAPSQMGNEVVRWAKLVIPLVVHSASKVRLRAAAAMEMGMPLLLKKQMDVAVIIEPLMSTKLIPELQKLFMSKNETNVLKLWPLFVRLLGKLLHRGGPFINSLLHLEELGFRSPSPTIKKIAFIAWKSLIDNFALNPDILCSAKRLKLLMQPLASIHARTEALLLTKVEVWWYLVVQLGPHLSSNFDQVAVPLLLCTVGSDSPSVPGTPARAVTQNGTAPSTPKTGPPGFNSTANTPRMSLNASVQLPSTFTSIQLLGLEMLLHYFLGPEVVAMAAKSNLVLSLEPLKHPLVSSSSSFTKHSAVLISNIKEGFTSVGRDAPDALLSLLWTNLVHFVHLTIESGSKKDRQGCEVLTLMLQALQSIITSEALPADQVLVLFEITVKGIPQRVLGSASYQVGKMDVLNGTPALFLILLLYNSRMLAAYIEDARFYECHQTLVGCGLSGLTSPLAFGEAVLGAVSRSAGSVQKKQLLRMWSAMVGPLTDTITKSNEVNQGDALEHNFSAMHSALLFPFTHLLSDPPLQPVDQKSMLATWSKLYKVFACCSSLVVTAEENICCEELCAKMAAALDRDALAVPSTLNAVAITLQVMTECVDFSPFTPQFQQKLKSPHTRERRRRNKALGNLSSFQSLLVQCLDVYLEGVEASCEATGVALVSCLSALFSNLALANAVHEALTSLIRPLACLYKQAAADPPTFPPQILAKLEMLLSELLACLQSTTLAFDGDLLALLSPLLCVLFPHRNKQHRNATTMFWNSTFANSVSRTYPDELRPVLSKAKEKSPIILPGFEVISVPDELSGHYSSESSQMETKLSGMPVSSVGKTNSLLPKEAAAVSTKLEFGSPKPPRRDVLEEEASIDFVFIPPETKERVLTEHQKEMKRTKRVDIPAMYNNLDASLDTSVFSQYTQSQDDSTGKLPTEQADEVVKETTGEVPQEAEVQITEAKEDLTPNGVEQEMLPETADVSMEDNSAVRDAAAEEDLDADTKQSPSANISGSSDVVSGTPQRSGSCSRRQAFITLEKYAEGKLGSPSTASTFTGSLVKTFNSKECNKTSSSQTAGGCSSSQGAELNSECPVNDGQESPRRPKDGWRRSEPVRLTERLPKEAAEDEDVIPDTQTEVEIKDDTLEEMKPSSLDSEQTLDDSQTEASPGEPRRSGRYRIRPQLPGEDPKDRDEKYALSKKRRSGVESKNDSPGSNALQGRPNTRSKQAAEEEDSRDRRRTRAQSESGPQGKSNKKIKLYSSSEEFLPLLEPRRRRSRAQESSQPDQQSDTQSEQESQSQSRSSKSTEPEKTQAATHQPVEVGNEPKTEAQEATVSPQTAGPSQESELVEETKNKRGESQVSSSADDQSQGGTASTSQVVRESDEVREEHETIEGADVIPDSQGTGTPSSSDSQPVLRTRRSKVSSEAAESQDKTETKDSSRRQSRSRVSEPTVHPAEARNVGMTRRSQVQEEHVKSSPSSTPESSQSLDATQRSKRRRSSLAANMESSESESQEVRENSSGPKKRGRKPRVQSLPLSPPAIASKDGVEQSDTCQKADPQSVETMDVAVLEEDLQASQSLEVAGNTEEQRNRERLTEADAAEPVKSEETPESGSKNNNKSLEMKKRRGRPPKASPGSTSPQVSEAGASAEAVGVPREIQEDSSCDPSAEDSSSPSEEATEKLQVSESSDEREAEVVEPGDVVTETEESLHSEQHSDVPVVEALSSSSSLEQHQDELPEAEDELPKAEDELPGAEDELPGAEDELPGAEDELPGAEDELPGAVDELPGAVDELPGAVDELPGAEDELPGAEDELPGAEDELPGAEDELPGAEDELPGAVDELPEEMLSASPEEENPSNQQSEADEDVPPLQERDDEETCTLESQDEERTQTSNRGLAENIDAAQSDASEPMSKQVPQDSPAKQKDLEAAMMPDVVQSPSGGGSRTRGTWSPSASPSTSILKKGQKRPLEEETPSPLVKSRRVSFANPIQQQETADDIDRRSPAVRTSSPRRPRMSSIPQPKHVTTPTKGLSMFSPRSLHSPGYRSSKKCLMSEMSQLTRSVSRDCIYPALVGCSAPVEAVLPQISSTMWCRGFGQLVRARNIKTVGDLSALTLTEIKTLPIRSPKISNVKKALKSYELQRKGRGIDELKSFDEMEMMTSELEETYAPPNQDEEEKTSGETLATELVDEPVPAEATAETDGPGHQTLDSPPEGPPNPEGLLSQCDALKCSMTPRELGGCSPLQLVQMHDQLGGLMRRVVVELQTRLCPTDAKP